MLNSEKLYFSLYYILNFFCYFLVFFGQIKSIIHFPLSFHFLQILSSSLSLIFLHATRNQPGYAEPEKSSKSSTEEEPKDIKMDSSAKISLETAPIVNLNLMPNNGCDKCNIAKLPLRSHHCEKCDRCVRGFDHHCWVLAGCIGENNRFKFIFFLLFQNISLFYSICGILKLLNNEEIESLIYLLTFLFSVMCLFGIIFFWVFLCHIYLLLTNQTTYEIFNENNCPYITIFAEERNKILAQKGIVVEINTKYRPFDIGVINNIFIYLFKMFNSNKEIRWEEIYNENLKTNKMNLSCFDKIIES